MTRQRSRRPRVVMGANITAVRMTGKGSYGYRSNYGVSVRLARRQCADPLIRNTG